MLDNNKPQASPEELIGVGAAVNAVAASKILTISGLPTETHTITLGPISYIWVLDVDDPSAAYNTFSVDDTVVDGDTAIVGTKTYTFRDSIAGVQAQGTITISGTPLPTETMVVGTTTYTFVVSRSVAGEITIDVDNDVQVTNIVTAITADSTDVSAIDGTGSTVVVSAASVGASGNSIVFTENVTGLAMNGGGVLGGTTTGLNSNNTANNILIGVSTTTSKDNFILGVTAGSGAGTSYGTGTVASTQVTAVSSGATTATVTALTAGISGNSIATTTSGGNVSFDSSTLLHGEAAQTPNGVLIGLDAEGCIDNLVLAVTGGAGEGTVYSTGTPVNNSATAVKSSSSTMTATALVAGAGGNTIALGENDANTSWAGGATHMTGGVDGTTGFFTADDTYLYVATDGYNTTAGAGWKKVALSSL